MLNRKEPRWHAAAAGAGALRPGNGTTYFVCNCTSMGWLAVSIGFRSKEALIVTFLPNSSWGTRHECEQTPPQPYSRLPEATCFPSLFRTAKVGDGGELSEFWPPMR